MKRIIALALACSLVLVGCGNNISQTIISDPSTTNIDSNTTISTEVDESPIDEINDLSDLSVKENSSQDTSEEVKDTEVEFDSEEDELPDFNSLDDPDLLQYIEDSVYAGLVDQIDNEDFVIEEVSAIYLSDEYLEEVAYNSKANIWFGYTLEELDERFQGQSYVFTLSDDGKTAVEPFEDYDDTYEKVIKNVAIGTGVILVCVTVSVVSGGLGAAPVSMIFAASAKTGTIMALSSAAIGSTTAGVITGIQTGDMDQALKAAALEGSESYKIGAIVGSVTGGLSEANNIRNTAKAAKEAKKFEASIEGLEGWQQAEARAAFQYGGSEQMTFLAGEEVPFGTPGATRPDVVRTVGDHLEAIEVKYYNLESSSSRHTLYSELEREISSRIVNMPEGTTQRIVLDVTNRGFSEEIVTMVKENIWTRLADIYPDIPIDIVGL